MNWFLIAILAPLLFAITMFIDKFLVNKYFKGGQGALVLYSCFIGLPIFILIGLFNHSVFSIKPLTAILIILSSFLYVLYLFPYFAALKRADTSSIAPLFQTIPVFTYLFAFFLLHETLSLGQILASLLIIFGSIGISLKWEGKSLKLNKNVLFLMLLVAILISLNRLFFKFFALESNFWTTSFWEYMGFFIFGVLLMIFKKSYRKDFVDSIMGKSRQLCEQIALLTQKVEADIISRI